MIDFEHVFVCSDEIKCSMSAGDALKNFTKFQRKNVMESFVSNVTSCESATLINQNYITSFTLLNTSVKHRMALVPVDKKYKNSFKLSIPHSPINRKCKQPQLP